MTDATQPDPNAPDSQPAGAAAEQPDPAAEGTGAESTDRPGDIPFDQAAAEHENPALE